MAVPALAAHRPMTRPASRADTFAASIGRSARSPRRATSAQCGPIVPSDVVLRQSRDLGAHQTGGSENDDGPPLRVGEWADARDLRRSSGPAPPRRCAPPADPGRRSAPPPTGAASSRRPPSTGIRSARLAGPNRPTVSASRTGLGDASPATAENSTFGSAGRSWSDPTCCGTPARPSPRPSARSRSSCAGSTTPLPPHCSSKLAMSVRSRSRLSRADDVDDLRRLMEKVLATSPPEAASRPACCVRAGRVWGRAIRGCAEPAPARPRPRGRLRSRPPPSRSGSGTMCGPRRSCAWGATTGTR